MPHPTYKQQYTADAVPNNLVGVERFELPTSCSQSRRATRLRYTPNITTNSYLKTDYTSPCWQAALTRLRRDAVILLKAIARSQRKLALECYTFHHFHPIKTQTMAKTRYLFISDLHLEPSKMNVSEAFKDYLRALSEQDALFILGDLFEVWLGDDDNTDFNQSIIEALNLCHADVYLMHGNRDFLIGSRFADQANLTLLPDPYILDLFGQPTLLLHGDSLCTLDHEYMAIRDLLRSEPFQADLLGKTLSERAHIAQQARKESQLHTGQTEMRIMDVTPDEVQLTFARHNVKMIIHGHTHRPEDHLANRDSRHCRRIVLGDWDKFGWQVIADDQTIRLDHFPIN